MTTKITVVHFLCVSVIVSTVFANYSDKMQEKRNSNRKTQIKLNISKFFLVLWVAVPTFSQWAISAFYFS